jgi:hypothetical protein
VPSAEPAPGPSTQTTRNEPSIAPSEVVANATQR